MKILSPTITFEGSPIRIAMPGFLLLAALGGTAVAILVMQRRRAPDSQGRTSSALRRERNAADRLLELRKLREQSMITDAEHDDFRRQILSGI